jgi:serine/threonine protein kinase
VLELTELAGRVSLVAEFVDGVDLSRCCRSTHLLPPRVVVEAMAEVASALDSAWTTPSPDTGEPLHLVHRDIKPENIRLSKYGEVKLLDFGIARTYQLTREALTATGQMPFTPGYAPPEVFAENAEVGNYTDVFAMGATLFRLLVGERFYEGKKLKAQLNLSADPEDFAAFVEERLVLIAHDGLREVLRGCLSYRKETRPSARALHNSLSAIADTLDGPTCARWARGVNFPAPSAVEGGSLTGQVLNDDRGMTVRIQRVVVEPPASSAATVLLFREAEDVPDPPPRPRWGFVLLLAVVLCVIVVPVVLMVGASLLGAGFYLF